MLQTESNGMKRNENWPFLAHRFDVWMKGKTKQRKLEVLKKKVKVPQKLLVIKNRRFCSDRAEILTGRSFRSFDLNEPEKSGVFWFFDRLIREKPLSPELPEIWKFLREHVLILLLTNGISPIFAPLGFFEKSKTPLRGHKFLSLASLAEKNLGRSVLSLIFRKSPF